MFLHFFLEGVIAVSRLEYAAHIFVQKSKPFSTCVMTSFSERVRALVVAELFTNGGTSPSIASSIYWGDEVIRNYEVPQSGFTPRVLETCVLLEFFAAGSPLQSIPTRIAIRWGRIIPPVEFQAGFRYDLLSYIPISPFLEMVPVHRTCAIISIVGNLCQTFFYVASRITACFGARDSALKPVHRIGQDALLTKPVGVFISRGFHDGSRASSADLLARSNRGIVLTDPSVFLCGDFFGM